MSKKFHVGEQIGLFGPRIVDGENHARPAAPSVDTRPVRRARPPETEEELPITSCPACDGTRSVVVRVDSDGSDLVTLRRCYGCNREWSTRKTRTDICAHGTYLGVPCEPCGRTWVSISKARRA